MEVMRRWITDAQRGHACQQGQAQTGWLLPFVPGWQRKQKRARYLRTHGLPTTMQRRNPPYTAP